jgi:predicted dehydrogenase
VSCTIPAAPGTPIVSTQNFSATLSFTDGSLATIVYGSAGARAVDKEYLEVHAGDRSGILDDFRRLTLYTGGGKDVTRGRGQDKGHTAQMAHLRAMLLGEADAGGPDPLDSMQVTFAALRSAQTGRAVNPAEVGTSD